MLKNLILYPIYLMLYKNWQFNTYMIKYSQIKIKNKKNKWISSFWLRKQPANIFLEGFEIFLYIEVDKKHSKQVCFT